MRSTFETSTVATALFGCVTHALATEPATLSKFDFAARRATAWRAQRDANSSVISACIASAATRGSAAWRIGRPTTM